MGIPSHSQFRPTLLYSLRLSAKGHRGLVKLPLIIITALLIISASVWLLYNTGDATEKPLYWVAPMDPNYRRDGPGKSPMGMDLVPVYQDDLNSPQSDNPGAVYVAPKVARQISMRTTQIQTGRLERVARAFGYIAYDTTQVHVLAAPTVVRVDYLVTSSVGERVLSGLPLFAISSDQLIKAQDAYLQVLNSDRQKRIEAEQKLQSMGFDDKAIGELQRDGAAQESVIFRAPVTGVVTELNAAQGAYISSGATIMKIQPLDRVWALLEVPTIYADQLKIGQPISINSQAYPGRTWRSQVDFIYSEVNPQTQTIKVRSTLDNQDGQLKPNMNMTAEIELAARAETLLAPRQSIIRLGKQNRAVLALGDGFFKSVEVQLGQENEQWVEILDGLEQGDMLVTSAQFLIDSESSKTSDFQRYSPADEPTIRTAWVQAIIEEVWLDSRKLRLAHQPIESWGMPSMTMNFAVEAAIPMEQLSVGQNINVKVVDDPDQPLYIVDELELLENEQ